MSSKSPGQQLFENLIAADLKDGSWEELNPLVKAGYDKAGCDFLRNELNEVGRLEMALLNTEHDRDHWKNIVEKNLPH